MIRVCAVLALLLATPAQCWAQQPTPPSKHPAPTNAAGMPLDIYQKSFASFLQKRSFFLN